MNKAKRIWLIVVVTLIPLMIVFAGIVVGIVSGDKDNSEKLSVEELMISLNTKINLTDDLNSAIYELQNMIDNSGYKLSLLTYEIDGVISKAEVIPSGTQITLLNLEDTEKKYFNGWKINSVGEKYYPGQVYTLQKSTKFVAEMLNKTVVTCIVDDQIYDTKYVIPNNSIDLPQLSDTEMHYFNGWKVAGITVVNRHGGSYIVKQDVNIIAEYLEHPTVTFEVAGQVLKTEQVKYGYYVDLSTLDDNETHYFNGWKIDGVGSSYNGSYCVTENIKFVADMVRKFIVTFVEDGKDNVVGYYLPNEIINLPSREDTETHYYNGWKVNGGDSVKGSYQINGDITFTLDMHENPIVTFMVNDEVYQTEQVKPNTYVTLPLVDNTETHHFNGWKIEGLAEVYNETYKVSYQNVVFVVNMVINNFVKTTDYVLPKLLNNVTDFYAMYIWSDGKNVYYSSSSEQYVLRDNNVWEKMIWNGENKYISGNFIWTDGKNYYHSNGTSNYVLKDNNTWEVIVWNGMTNIYGQYVWKDDNNVYYSYDSKQYVLTENSTWEPLTWNGLTNFRSDYIWTDGENYYYSNGSSQYVLKENNTWEAMTWNGMTSFNGGNVWVLGDNVYYAVKSYNYNVLDKETKTWVSTGYNKTINGGGVWTDGDKYFCNMNLVLDVETHTWRNTSFYTDETISHNSNLIWSDGESCYMTGSVLSQSGSWKSVSFVSDLATRTWLPKIWTNENGSTISLNTVWSDGTNYYSGGNYKFNQDSQTWSAVNWGKSSFDVSYIWSDGVNYYYSDYVNELHYIMNFDSYSLERINDWNGETYNPREMWTDGTNCYLGNTVFNRNTKTWESVTWKGKPSDFNRDNVWTDGVSYYYSDGINHYVINTVTKTFIPTEWTGMDNFYGKNIWTDGVNRYVHVDGINYIFNK